MASEREIVENEPEVIDADDGDPSFGLDAVEIEAIDPAGYTDEIMSDRFGTVPTPDQDQTDLNVDPGFTPGPLGLGGPAGSGLMRLEDAVAAQHEMNAREAARLRNMRRR